MLKGISIAGSLDKPLHNKWRQFYETRMMTVKREPLLQKHYKVFTIGSCFAAEIRSQLTALGIHTLPDYASIPLDDERYQIDTLPKQLHMNYYNSFSIRQEFERAIGLWDQAPDDHWHARYRLPCQDPYRRLVFGATPDDLNEAIGHINHAMREAIHAADAFFITLGMTEVFRKTNNGMIACQKPNYLGGAGDKETQLYLSTFRENYDNMARVVEIIQGINPKAMVVVTVSPVPLERTFTGRDIFISNMEGKCTLRAVAGELARNHANVRYYPSFELVMGLGEQAFRPDDLRHIDPQAVSIITRSFIQAFLEEEAGAVAV